MEYTSIDVLEKALNQKIDTALQTNVLEQVKKTMIKNIYSKVYDAYTPVLYKRRYKSGGLVDERNIVGILLSNQTLEVENITPYNTSVDGYETSEHSLAYAIEYGLIKNIFNDTEYQWNFPRMFMNATQYELDKGLLKNAFITGLKLQGCDIV